MPLVSLRQVLAGLSIAALLALSLGACDKPGDACTSSPGSCKDKQSHLVCVNKALVLETCLGKGGCNDEGKSLVCDNTIAGVNDGCGHEGSRACSSDGTKELRCRDAKYAVEWSCKGGCTLDANNSDTPKCTPTGEVGDVCPPNFIVCDGAAKTELNCQNGKLAVSRTCHGELGCQSMPGGGVRCDKSQALEGEACREEGTGSCDTTKKNVLVCTGGHYKTTLHCLGPLGCELPGNYSVRCDMSVVPQDAPCTEDMAISCSTEGKQVQCHDGKFGLDPKWKPKKGETCANRYRVSYEIEKFEAR